MYRHNGARLTFFVTLTVGAVLLYWLQALRVVISVLFGLIYDAIFDQSLAMSTLGLIGALVLAAFVTPMLAPKRSQARPAGLFVSALAAAMARIPMTMDQPIVRLASSVVVIAAAGVYVTLLLREQPRTFATGLVLACAADQLLRVAGNTYDVGLRDWWLLIQAVLSIATAALAWRVHLRATEALEGYNPAIDLRSGVSIGALLFFETSLSGFPNVLARWSGVDYVIVAPLLMAVTLLPLFPRVRKGTARLLSGPLGGLAFLSLLLLGWAVGRMGSGGVGLGGMLIAQYLMLLLPMVVVATATNASHPVHRDRTGYALALGMVSFLLISFAFAFTFTYPYTIPAFRDKGLLVVLLAATLVCGPVFPHSLLQERRFPAARTSIASLVIAMLVVSLTAFFAWPPAITPAGSGPIRAATYNIHYGYDTFWHLSLEEQARTIEESGAQIVVLQEVDAGRTTSYGVDNALWLARRLGMKAVYGPALEGLSGIALLTRYPIVEADTAFLESRLEQTAIVHARVMVGERSLDAYGVWLGLEPEERARQLDDALAYIGEATPAILGGDFNSPPDSPVYARIRAAGFEDPFVVAGLDPAPTSPALDPDERIDFVWSRGMNVQDALVLDSLASDHRMVLVELALP